MSLVREFGFIVLFTCIGSLYSLMSGLAPKPWVQPDIAPGEIRYEDAAALDVLWVDARSQTAYHENHIDGALWFDLENWDESLIAVTEQWLIGPRPIVIYCSSESCSTSREVADQLRSDLPEAEIYSLKGGWNQ